MHPATQLQPTSAKGSSGLFSHNIELEPESDLVKLGKLLHENSYKRKMKEVQINRIKVDFMESRNVFAGDKGVDMKTNKSDFIQSREIRPSSTQSPKQDQHEQARFEPSSAQSNASPQKELVIHEVKGSRKMQNAHLNQLLYYMYYLKKNYSMNVLKAFYTIHCSTKMSRYS